MSKVIDDLFAKLELHPILMEVGASEHYPKTWNSIARHSVYVGVGPESRPIHDFGVFHRSHLVNEIVTTCEENDHTLLYVTNDPVYSTLLEPKPANSSALLDRPAHPKQELSVRSTTIDALINRLQLPQVDWLQTNVNGVDLRVYQSVNDRIRKRILVLDTVLDLVDLWTERGSPVAAYQEFVDDGLWLSRVSSYGFVTMRPESARRIRNIDNDLCEQVFTNQVRRTPGWLFVRFFRTLESLAAGDFAKRDYILLWTFALLDEQPGYAADITFEYERIFGPDHLSHSMLEETLSRMRTLSRRKPVQSIAKKFLPAVIRRRLKPLLLRHAESTDSY